MYSGLPFRHPGVQDSLASSSYRVNTGEKGTHGKRERRESPPAVSIDWAEIYRATYPDLVRFIHRKVWDGERAQELAQEVFVRALREHPERPRPWLFTVAANLARDEARGAIRRKAHLTLLRTETEERQENQEGAAETMLQEETTGRVREALEALSERDREVLLLWSGGLSYGEIATETGLSPRAIGTTLARARKRLAAEYDEREKDHAARQ